MKYTIFGFVTLVTVFTFSMVPFHGLLSGASAGIGPEVELTVKINEKGFFDKKGSKLGLKNPLKIPKGKGVKINFVFDEALKSLAIGDVHQIAITADDGWSIESDKIWFFHRETSVTFVAGEKGRKKYRGYCIVDCIGMDRLNNLVFIVE